MRVQVLTQRAEDSRTLLNQTYAQHIAVVTNTSIRVRSTRLGPTAYDSLQVQRQATLVRMLSITESFCAARLTEHVESVASTTADPLTAMVWDKSFIDATGTWPNIKDAYKTWIAVRPAWSPVDGLVEARNAIAHGLGDLTRRQLRTEQATRSKIKNSDIDLRGRRVYLDDAMLNKAREKCLSLIQEVDLAVSAI